MLSQSRTKTAGSKQQSPLSSQQAAFCLTTRSQPPPSLSHAGKDHKTSEEMDTGGRHPETPEWHGALPVTERVQGTRDDKGALQLERRQTWVWSCRMLGLHSECQLVLLAMAHPELFWGTQKYPGLSCVSWMPLAILWSREYPRTF